MPLLPIDVSITVQRTADIRPAANENAARPEVVHQQFADKLNKDVQQQDHQIIKPNKTEDNAVDPDGRGNNGQAGSRNKKKKGSEKDKQPAHTGGGSLFDVSV